MEKRNSIEYTSPSVKVINVDMSDIILVQSPGDGGSEEIGEEGM